jgi:hypothetical protein
VCALKIRPHLHRRPGGSLFAQFHQIVLASVGSVAAGSTRPLPNFRRVFISPSSLCFSYAAQPAMSKGTNRCIEYQSARVGGGGLERSDRRPESLIIPAPREHVPVSPATTTLPCPHCRGTMALVHQLDLKDMPRDLHLLLRALPARGKREARARCCKKISEP